MKNIGKDLELRLVDSGPIKPEQVNRELMYYTTKDVDYIKLELTKSGIMYDMKLYVGVKK